MPKPKQPQPPVEGKELERWRDVAKRYRHFLLQGLSHERSADAVTTYLCIIDRDLARSQARVLVEEVVGWTTEHHGDWLEGRTG